MGKGEGAQRRKRPPARTVYRDLGRSKSNRARLHRSLTLLEPSNYQKYTQKSLQYDYLLRKTVSINDEKEFSFLIHIFQTNLMKFCFVSNEI